MDFYGFYLPRRSSLNEQIRQTNVSSRNRSCGEPSHSRPTYNRGNDTSCQKLYRSTINTRRNTASKLRVFTEFDPDESANTSGAICEREPTNSTHKTDNTNTNSSLNGQRSARIKPKSENTKKANVRSKCISNVKPSKVQSESHNSKRKAKGLDNKEGTFQNSTWPSKPKDSLKHPQDVSKTAVNVQNSKAPRPKIVSPKKNEVEKTKISSQEGQLLSNINSTKTSSASDNMSRKRKLDLAAVQTTEKSSEIATKEIPRDETQIFTQLTEHSDNKSIDQNTTSSPRSKFEHTSEECDTKEELNSCANKKDLMIISDKPYCFTNFHNVDMVEKDISVSNLLDSSAKPGDIGEQALPETDRETQEENKADVTDDRDLKTDCNDTSKSEQTPDNISQSNSSSPTPIKRSARISERKLKRQKFSDGILNIEDLYLNSSVQTAKRNLSATNNDTSKKHIKCRNSTPKKIELDKITAGSSMSKKVATSQNTKSRPRARKVGARIKVTPLNPKNRSSKLHTKTVSKNCRVSVGDIVWGKVHGHPWWPGRVLAVSGIIDRNAHVAWFGSNTSSIMACNELAAFLANFNKRFRRHKRGAYRTAVHEARAAAYLREEKK